MLRGLLSRRDIVKTAPLAIAAAAVPARISASDIDPLQFLVIGDWGRRGEKGQRVTADLASQLTSDGRNSFTVSTGDNFYGLGVRSITSSHWQESYEGVYASHLKRNWFAVLGNHDYGGNVEAQIAYRGAEWHGDRSLDGPWGWRMDDRWWDLRLTAFGRDDIHFFFIDTVTWRGKESFPTNLLGASIRLGDHQAQRSWLAQGLMNSPARFKIVVGHHGIYSVGKHGGRMEMKDLDNILHACGATAYINGHDHCLYHIQKGAMNYICSGAGSEILPDFTGDPDIPGCVLPDACAYWRDPEPSVPIWRTFLREGGVAQFTAHRDSIEFRFVTLASSTYPLNLRPR